MREFNVRLAGLVYDIKITRLSWRSSGTDANWDGKLVEASLECPYSNVGLLVFTCNGNVCDTLVNIHTRKHYNKIFIVAVLERWLIHFNETKRSFVYLISQ